MCQMVHMLNEISVDQWERAKAHVAAPGFDPVQEADDRGDVMGIIPTPGRAGGRRA